VYRAVPRRPAIKLPPLLLLLLLTSDDDDMQNRDAAADQSTTTAASTPPGTPWTRPRQYLVSRGQSILYPRQRLSSFCRRMASGTAVNVISSMNTKNSLAGVVLRLLSTTPERSAAVKRHTQNVDLCILAS